MPQIPKILSLFLAFFVLSLNHYGQSIRPFHQQFPQLSEHSIYQHSTRPNQKRRHWVNGLALGGYSSMMLYMGTVWYAQEDLSRFHFFNDMHEWKQIDKFGHILGAYHQSRMMTDLYAWAGVPKKKAMLLGSTVGFVAQSSIEIFDGFGEKWGASMPDVAANFVGSALSYMNYAIWNEPRIQLKMSYVPSNYTKDPNFDRLFGSNFPERLLKDYNGQTYWLSMRVHAFLPEGTLKSIYPKWLNLAIGYGADGLEGGYGIDPIEQIRAREYRQYYLSLDVDLNNIHTKSGFLNSLFSIVNIVRIPLPAVQFDKNGVAFKAWR